MDDMIDLYYSIGQRYRGKSVWVMSDQTFATLYKLKESHGKNIWKSSIVEGEPFQLLGCNVEICESMPAPIAGNKPVLFGDFSQYLIADRNNRSLKRLNELYAASGQVGFLMTQRVDAKLLIPQAIKYLQIKE